MSRPNYDVKESYTGTGSLAAYTFDFKIERLEQLLVIEINNLGVETQRVRGTDLVYIDNVVFDSTAGGGTVTLNANLAASYQLILLLADDEPIQDYEFANKSTFTLRRFEYALDNILGAVQRLAYLAKRSFKLHDADDVDTFDTTFPIGIADNGGKLLQINDDGDGLEYGPLASQITDGTAALGVAYATETSLNTHIANNTDAHGIDLKADDSAVVHITGTETITGAKKFENASGITVAGQSTLSAPPTNTLAHFSGVDATNSSVSIDTYAGAATLVLRRANTSAAAPSAPASGDILGQITAQGYGTAAYIAGSKTAIRMTAREAWSDTTTGTSIDFLTCPVGSVTTAIQFMIAPDGVIQRVQPAQTSKAAAATLTSAEVRASIIEYTGALASLQLPTGTDLQTSTGAVSNISFDFSVINTGSGVATLTTNTGLTLTGSMAVTNGTSASFRARRTGSNTFTIYRMS